jgi:hypothetical protein
MITGFFMGVETGMHSTWTIFMNTFSCDLVGGGPPTARFLEQKIRDPGQKVNRLVG